MPRTNALSILSAAATPAQLAEVFRAVIENIQTETLYQIFRNNNWSGDPDTGSVLLKRIAYSVTQPKGTARTAQKGNALTVPEYTLAFTVHNEIAEEATRFDIDHFGVPNLMQRRAPDHVRTLAWELDNYFYTTQAAAALRLR